jgi:CheY-like chemotaxis protein
MAEIFLAAGPDPLGERRLVILKRILPDLREREEFIHMFLDEARISASLAHPNIAQVYELGKQGDELFMAMEFVAGQSLASIQRRSKRLKRPIPIGFAALVGRQLCQALDHAHNFRQNDGERSPIIHRDVSPTNVMVTYDGQVKVIDFGVAKATGSLSRTQTGNIKGSRGYMSPEQARGAPLDARSDIFSSGIVLHELLTGKLLFLKESELLTFRGILRDDIPSPIAANPGVPRALSDVVMTSLQRPVDARFKSAQDMARAIAVAVPALMFTREQAGALMKELFAEEQRETDRLMGMHVGEAQALDTAQKLLELGVPRGSSTDMFGAVPTGVIKLEESSSGEISGVGKALREAVDEPPVEGATVMSVDDSVISRDFIEAHLESAGFPVLGVGSAKDALAMLIERTPDLILLDVVMPEMNGFELCKLLRQRCARRPFLPILFLTSNDNPEQRLQAIAAGADGFITKPYEPQQLIATVRAHLQRAAFLERCRVDGMKPTALPTWLTEPQ